MDPANKHLDLLLSDMARSPALYVWISILVVSIALGAYALLMSLVFSLEIFEFSIKIPWGMMVSNYVFLVGSSTGLCIVASLGYVFGLQRYQLIGKRSLFLALIAIIFGLCSIGLHLGHPERGMIYNLLTPNFRSAMWWMTTLYPFYIACIAAWFWFLARGELVEIAGMSAGLKARIYRLLLLNRMEVSEDSANRDLRWATVFGALALLFGLLAYSVEGTLFAHTEARPFWYGALYTIDFFLGASFCGFAWLLAAVTVTYKIRSCGKCDHLSVGRGIV
jgi:Ni/Fe-hydrogenase subunit HybB-like protein